MLERNGTVEAPAPLPVRIEKRITPVPGESALEIAYNVQWPGNVASDLLFGVEFAANLLAGDAFDRYCRSDDRDLGKPRLGRRACDDALNHIALCDDWQRLEFGLRFSTPARVFRFPIETVSQSEDGQERVYQGSVLLPCWRLPAAAPGPWTQTIRIETINLADR